MSNIRVRIAPSPTGNLHVGTARTALFNYLFARAQGGKFILRVEDTDLTRSHEDYLQNIYDGLKSLGLEWDEGPDIQGPYGPYRQSERFDIYLHYANKLLADGKAYRCYCTTEDLEKEKQAALEAKRPYVYSQKCLHVSQAIREQYEENAQPSCIRFQVPSKNIIVQDIIRGDISFDTELIGDFVLVKSDGSASYNFSVVIDDLLMKISHVIRGEDHISNTPKQILLYEALGEKIPYFAHCGMILAPDRTKLSKRHGATAVSDYVHQGYLTEAMVNFLALLGWSPPDGQEVKSIQELINCFTLNRISPTPAIFDIEKLNWLNGQYIKSMALGNLLTKSLPHISHMKLSEYSENDLCTILSIVREPLTVLSELPKDISYFFGMDVDIDDEQALAVLQKDHTFLILKKFIELAKNLDYSNLEEIDLKIKVLKEICLQVEGVKVKDIMFSLRVALTGRTKGADLKTVISLLGKDKVMHRLGKIMTLSLVPIFHEE